MSVMTLKRPSERTIAFAVSIVLSKPEDLTIKDYVELLRRHVAKGRRENAISSAYRHLDRSSYWRSEYERTKDALNAAEAESVNLKVEVIGLKARLEASKPHATAKKRKKPDEDIVLVPRSPKKSKLESSPVKRIAASADVLHDFDCGDIGDIRNILMRSFYQIYAMLKSHDKTELTLLAHQCIRAAATVPQVVQQAIGHRDAKPHASNDFLKAVLTAATRAIDTLIFAFTRLSHVPGGAELQGHVTYAYVHMLRKLLDLFGEASAIELPKPTSHETPMASEKMKQSSSKVKSKQPKLSNIKDNVTLNLFTKFLCDAVDRLEAKTDAHNSLFEGFAYVVLDTLAARVYTLVFGHARGNTIGEEIKASNRKLETEYSSNGSSRPEGKQVSLAKLEAPYLIHLLTRIMTVAPAHLGAIVSSKTGKAKQANNRVSTKGALAIAAKERIQRTLVNCMFGTDDVDGTDPFKDCLKMPTVDMSALPMPKVKEVEVQDWFKEEVWVRLGWEILSTESDW